MLDYRKSTLARGYVTANGVRNGLYLCTLCSGHRDVGEYMDTQFNESISLSTLLYVSTLYVECSKL